MRRSFRAVRPVNWQDPIDMAARSTSLFLYIIVTYVFTPFWFLHPSLNSIRSFRIPSSAPSALASQLHFNSSPEIFSYTIQHIVCA